MKKRVFTEFLGCAWLLIAVVGSGIMGETLSQGNTAIALLANSMATGAALYVLIQVLSPISGAHFNPIVSTVEWLCKRLSTREFILFIPSQVTGAITGVIMTHAIFGQKLLQISTHDRALPNLYLSEAVATFGLISIILLSKKWNLRSTPSTVALYIAGAYWFTSSTSFANPAVTIARSFTDTFSGILWTGAPGFIAFQAAGAFAALILSKWT